MNRHQELSSAYAELRGRLMAVLYEVDPAGMGSQVGAPMDEYSEEATRLIPRLRTARTREDVQRVLSDMFPAPSERLISLVYAEWAAFAQFFQAC